MKKLMMIWVLLVVFTDHVVAQQIKVTDKPLSGVLQQIQMQTDVRFYWIPQEVEGVLVSLDADCKDIEAVMKQLLSGTDLKYTIFNGRYIHVLKNRTLVNQMPAFTLWHTSHVEGQLSSSLLTDSRKADSENKIYVIGNREKPSMNEMVELRGDYQL